MFVFDRILIGIFCAALLGFLGACSGGANGPQPGLPRDRGEAVYGEPNPAIRPDQGWVILLGVAPTGRAEAQAKAADALKNTDLRGVTVEERDGRWFVVWSRTPAGYPSPTGDRAQADLAMVKAIAGPDDTRPYAGAFLLQPPKADASALPSLDLRSVRQGRLSDEPLYTLQIAAYGRIDGKQPSDSDRREFRRAAESAAARLRAEGERAFYYHADAAGLSHVTIGVFTVDDLGLNQGEQPSPEFDRVRRAYPDNLVNGAQLLQSNGEGRKRPQPSFPVAIPE